MVSLSLGLQLPTQPPHLSIAAGVALGRALVQACPTSAPSPVLESARRLDAAVIDAQDAWQERERRDARAGAEDPRLVNTEAGRSWTALHRRLEGLALLPGERFPQSVRAAGILKQLFGDEGLSFLSARYEVLWSTMAMLLRRID